MVPIEARDPEEGSMPPGILLLADPAANDPWISGGLESVGADVSLCPANARGGCCALMIHSSSFRDTRRVF